MQVVMDNEFVETKTVTQDSRGRISVGTGRGGQQYSVSANQHGQILLTPVVTIPEYEMWLWNSPDAISSVRSGLADAAAGRLHDMGSFATFAAQDEP